MKAQRFDTYGMTCAACPRLVERKLERLDGVVSAEADLVRGTTSVVYDAALVEEAAIACEIAQCGFRVGVRLRPRGGQG